MKKYLEIFNRNKYNFDLMIGILINLKKGIIRINLICFEIYIKIGKKYF